MTKRLLLFYFSLLAIIPHTLAQINTVKDGRPDDSTTFTFTLPPADSLTRPVIRERIDTTGTMLWKIGNNNFKPFFSASPDTSYAIMTGTTNPYPVNANDWFILKLEYQNINTIVNFRHKYQTTANRDGGIVEFSFDNGINWQNALDSCNADSFPNRVGIHTANFYTVNDTLPSGEPAFTGSSAGWIHSRIQFGNYINPFITRNPKDGCQAEAFDTIFLRFRFVSDDTLESLDGWIVDDIKVEHDIYWGHVADVKDGESLRIYPNPSTGIVNFPALRNEKEYHVEITNHLGRTLLNQPYKQQIDLSAQPAGLYFYRVTNGDVQYNGKLLIE